MSLAAYNFARRSPEREVPPSSLRRADSFSGLRAAGHIRGSLINSRNCVKLAGSATTFSGSARQRVQTSRGVHRVITPDFGTQLEPDSISRSGLISRHVAVRAGYCSGINRSARNSSFPGIQISSPPPGTPQQANPLHRGVVARSTIEPSSPASPLARTSSNPPAPERSWNSQSPLPVEAAPAA